MYIICNNGNQEKKVLIFAILALCNSDRLIGRLLHARQYIIAQYNAMLCNQCTTMCNLTQLYCKSDALIQLPQRKTQASPSLTSIHGVMLFMGIFHIMSISIYVRVHLGVFPIIGKFILRYFQ